MLTYLGPSVIGSATLQLLGRSAGCWIAYRLQHLAAVLSVSLLSARMLLEALAPTLDALEKPSQPAAAAAAQPDASSSDSRAVILYRPRRPPWLHASAKPRREALAWLLAVASLQSQRGRGFKLPLYLQLPLLPLLGVEALLKHLANRLTAAGFPGLPPPSPRASKAPRRPQAHMPAWGRRFAGMWA